jgi:Transposase IS66 family/zinc-finger binding domain of transposase IS66/Transposase C of IS166 homeodomain
MSSTSAAPSASDSPRPLDFSCARVPHFGVEALLTNPDLPLPDDGAALRQLVRDLLAEVRRLRQENEQLRHRLDQALRLHYGRRSERSRPRRARIPRGEGCEGRAVTRPGHGRQPLPDHLPRERVEYDLTEADKPCPCCGGPRTCIGEQASEQLDYRPASYFVVQHVRKTYACRSCDGPSERRFSTAGPSVGGPIPKGYAGYLQADALAQYEGLFATGAVIHVACWAHARRPFVEAQASAPAEAEQALKYIRKLYKGERELGERFAADDDAGRQQHRSGQTAAVREEFHAGLVGQQARALPKSPLGEAVGHALSHWDALMRYTEQGYLAIDTNLSERALRQVVVGRVNWQFCGSAAGAGHRKTRRAATSPPNRDAQRLVRPRPRVPDARAAHRLHRRLRGPRGGAGGRQRSLAARPAVR